MAIHMPGSERHISLLGLLHTRRFTPYFLTQFLGAFNDNVFRQALILLITSGVVTAVAPNTLNNIALFLFILPFFLFSALAGQFADKYEKGMLIRRIKIAELVIMLFAAVGFWFDAVWFLLGVLFCMGFQSTCFGPLKYSIMPQHLSSQELVSGNALVQQGTYIAILLGSITGVVLNMETAGGWWAPAGVVSLALLGYLASRFIPEAPPAAPELPINWNLWRETLKIVSYACEVRTVWFCILGISWFWLLGAAYTTQLKVFVDDYLLGTELVYALLLATFSIAIGVGSILCDKLTRENVELGLVPIGALGVSLFSADLYFSWQGLPRADELLTVAGFLAEPSGWRVMAGFAGIGIFGGLYIVPLFTYVQYRSRRERLARIIAAVNILNALFMVMAAVMGIVFVALLGISIPGFFLLLAGLNLLVTGFLLTRVPDFLQRLAGLRSMFRDGER